MTDLEQAERALTEAAEAFKAEAREYLDAMEAFEQALAQYQAALLIERARVE